jgi:GT2 family glycosyltransferase
MLLSIIIVNYKSSDLVLDCLRSLLGDRDNPLFEVIVVDNASGDDSRQKIKSAFPGVRWLAMDDNGGFARGNNEGIRRSHGDSVLLLNGDTLPSADSVEECYRRLAASEYVAAGVQLLNADGSPQISGMYVMKGGLNYLLPLPWLGSLLRSVGGGLGVKKPHVSGASATNAAPIDVDWINGAFLMVKRSAIDRAGLLDEDFFLFAEEAEWCSRIKKNGRLCIFGDLHVVHLQGETTNQEFGSEGKGYYNFYDRKGLQVMLSNFVRIRKQFGVGWFLFQLLVYLADIPVFLLGLVFSKRYSLSQWLAFCKNIGAILRLTPTIIKNKPYFYKVL